MCHGLCHNPAIPARVGPFLAVSLGYTQKAANMLETRMNTASLCSFVFLYVCLYSFTLGNGMEEVVGSIPTRSTKSLQMNDLSNANGNLHQEIDRFHGTTVSAIHS